MKTPYITPFFRALFNGTTEAQEIEIDQSAPDEYWLCVGIDKAALPWLEKKMNCTHEWRDSTTPAGPEWYCAKCKALYSEVKNQPKAVAKRAWVSLTHEMVEEVWEQVESSDFRDCVHPFARAIENKSKELND